jgi:hypothetical protein
MKSIAQITIPSTRMVLERSFGFESIGAHESTMELFFHDGAGHGMIEWNIPTLDRTEHIGLFWDNDKNLTDYDGVFSLPPEAITFLEANEFKVSDDFRC